jgi:hypothetical protein
MEDFAPVPSEEQIQHKVAKRAELPNQTANKYPHLHRTIEAIWRIEGSLYQKYKIVR